MNRRGFIGALLAIPAAVKAALLSDEVVTTGNEWDEDDLDSAVFSATHPYDGNFVCSGSIAIGEQVCVGNDGLVYGARSGNGPIIGVAMSHSDRMSVRVKLK